MRGFRRTLLVRDIVITSNKDILAKMQDSRALTKIFLYAFNLGDDNSI